MRPKTPTRSAMPAFFQKGKVPADADEDAGGGGKPKKRGKGKKGKRGKKKPLPGKFGAALSAAPTLK